MKDRHFEQFAAEVNEKLDKILQLLIEQKPVKKEHAKKIASPKIDFIVDDNLIIKIEKDRGLIDKYKVAELKEICRFLPCSPSGNKAKLILSINTKLDRKERNENR